MTQRLVPMAAGMAMALLVVLGYIAFKPAAHVYTQHDIDLAVRSRGWETVWIKPPHLMEMLGQANALLVRQG
jgi:hypothetical protein